MNTLIAKLGMTKLIAAAVVVVIAGLLTHYNWLVVTGLVLFVLFVLGGGGT
jgi:hypothetical protein